MKLADLKLNPDNPRNIRPEKLDKLAQSIKDFPKMMLKRPIVYDENKIIIGGNMRYKAIEKLGMTEIPDEWTSDASDFTPEERKRFIMQDNAEMGEHDWDMVANQYELEDLEAWGIDVPYADIEAEVEEDEAPEVSSEPPVSQLGSIYQLGRHRVMCGDSTDFGQVSDLLDGEQIDFVFTDPPYGINEKGDRSKRGGLTKGNKLDDFIDDSIEYAQQAIEIVNELNIPTQVWFGANYYSHSLPETNNWLVWDKRVEEKQHDTQSDCELAWVKTNASSVRIFRHLWKGLMKDSERGQRRVHPTQKPVELSAWCFNQYKAGSKVLDLFLGSGSTLIACEQTDRTCYGMELDPKYVDVIRKRYWKFTHDNNEEGWEDGTARVD